MKPLFRCLFSVLLPLVPAVSWGQSVGIGNTNPNAAAALDITASGKGLLIPRMDSATRVGIASPPTGLMVFQFGTTYPAHPHGLLLLRR